MVIARTTLAQGRGVVSPPSHPQAASQQEAHRIMPCCPISHDLKRYNITPHETIRCKTTSRGGPHHTRNGLTRPGRTDRKPKPMRRSNRPLLPRCRGGAYPRRLLAHEVAPEPAERPTLCALTRSPDADHGVRGDYPKCRQDSRGHHEARSPGGRHTVCNRKHPCRTVGRSRSMRWDRASP